MEPWAIAAIVIMCIVFTAILLLYAGLYIRFTRRIDGRVVSSTTLYYWDFYRTLQKVNLPQNDDHLDPSVVLQAIAHDMTSIYSRKDVSPQTLTLARFDKVAQTYVALDLNVLLSASHKSLFVRQTAYQPLVLLQRREEDGLYRSDPSTTKSFSSRRTSHLSILDGFRSSPTILPASPLITTETDVTVSSQAYCFQADPTEPVPPIVVKMIESGLRSTSRAMLATDDKEFVVVVDPMTKPAPTILVRHRHNPPQRIAVARPESIRYCITETGDWRPYTRPFRLPVGRWCVRVECIARDGSIRSDSRVFTVEEAFSPV
jgi:hypothetical protein